MVVMSGLIGWINKVGWEGVLKGWVERMDCACRKV